MRLCELKDLIGKKTPSFEEIRKRHSITSAQLQAQLTKGIKVEHEHTNSKAIAREIALDHLSEFPDYYDRLEKAEK